MTESIQILMLLIAYRLSCLVVGLLFGYMGYSLYRTGVLEIAGDVKASWGDRHLLLKRVAPGALLAICGVLVAGSAVVRPIVVEHRTFVMQKVADNVSAKPAAKSGFLGTDKTTPSTKSRLPKSSPPKVDEQWVDTPLVDTDAVLPAGCSASSRLAERRAIDQKDCVFDSTKIMNLPFEDRDPVSILSLTPSQQRPI
jgi:hypothetical protein